MVDDKDILLIQTNKKSNQNKPYVFSESDRSNRKLLVSKQ